MKSKHLMIWWIQACILFFSGALLHHFGAWEALWEYDKTNISWLIIGAATYITGWCGKKTYDEYKGNIDYIEIPEEINYTTQQFTTLGLIGTVIGFMIMLIGTFVGIDISDLEQVKHGVQQMASGMGTALTTTLTGLGAWLVTSFQLMKLRKINDD